MSDALDVAGLVVELPTRAGLLQAVRGVDLQVARGEMLCLVGESGCGKSMTALALMGLLPEGAAMRADRLRLLGAELPPGAIARLRGDRVAMIFQDPMSSLDPSFGIGDQMVEGLLYHRPATRRRAALLRAAELLEVCGIDDPRRRLSQYPHQLSGGMRQRVMIATALMTEPAVLIADEPTTALDVTIQAQVLSLLRQLQRQFALGILLITHDLAVVGRYADRVGVMYAGEIVEHAPAREVFARPLHPYTRALIACKPSVAEPPRAPLGFVPGQVPSLVGAPTGCVFRDRCGLATPPCAGVIPWQTLAGRDYRCIIAPAAMPGLAPVAASVGLDLVVAPGAAPVLELRQVAVAYPGGPGQGVTMAVRDVSLVVPRGAIFGIVGESGSGKSSLARVMLGLQRPAQGRVVLLGRDVAGFDRRARARAIQPVLQDPASSLNPRRGIGAAIRLPLDVHGVGSARERDAAVRGMMDRCGLPARLHDALPAQLSGGQRQRVAIAAALVLRPAIVVCDEPTSALDVSIQAQILNLLLELRAEFGLTYVLISHDLEVIRHMADRIAVMRRGELVEQGAADAMFRSPQHPYTRSLLGTVERLEEVG